MVTKAARLILCIFIFFLSIPAVFAKTSDNDMYFEVFIQKYDAFSSVYKDYYSLRAKGDVKRVDINTDLEVGKYRYRIRPEEASDDSDYSDWFYFEISDESTVKASPVDVNLSLGYICPVILFDDVIPDYMGERYWPLSGTVNFDFIPIKTRAGNFGFSLKGFYSRMEKNASSYKITGNLISAYFDLVYQKKLSRIFTIDLHAGAGGIWFYDFAVSYENGISTKKMNSLDMSFDGGLALNIFLAKHLFLRTGADFTYSIMSDMILGEFIPEAGLGLHF